MKLRIQQIREIDSFGTVEITAASTDGLIPHAEIEFIDVGIGSKRCVGDELEVDFGDLDRTRKDA